ncbi:uncharacterized protein M6B38_403085 [Iris pallida]|uniref:Uncharacterized protein n=1 Tax=Iris pallida TaxID=29817 RepID=A0AAX6EEF6_IRIPA|nr:uncharacterized protein M6B38_194810 [Iris pallida]KAJ6819238.1 uncharacterized protein M6B38_403085 [Iris pallida]
MSSQGRSGSGTRAPILSARAWMGLPSMPWIHVAPVSMRAPANSEVQMRPPIRFPASRTETSKRAEGRVRAAVRPAMPAPTMMIFGLFSAIIGCLSEEEEEEKSMDELQWWREFSRLFIERRIILWWDGMDLHSRILKGTGG